MTDDELLLAISDIMDKKIQPLETNLNNKIDAVEQSLNNKIDAVEQSLNNKINVIHHNLQNQITRLNLCYENDLSPRLQNIEDCYLSTFERYKNRSEQLDQLQLDVSIIKRVVMDHSERLKRIS